MLDGIWNTLTSPVALLRGMLGGTANSVSSVFSGGLGAAIGGAVTGVAAGALATLFVPELLSLMRHIGKPEWANATASYLRANPNFFTQMMHAGLAGATVSGVVGGVSALATSVQSGFSAVPAASEDPSRNGARAAAQAQNVGHAVASTAVVGAAALAGLAIYRSVTGRDLLASAPSAQPVRVSDVPLPALPVGGLQTADVQSPSRPVAMQNAQVSVGGAVRE